MLYFILILLILVVLGLAAALTYLTKNQSTKNNPVNEQLAVLLERINGMNRENSELRTMIDQKLSETHASNRAQFGQSAQMVFGGIGRFEAQNLSDLRSRGGGACLRNAFFDQIKNFLLTIGEFEFFYHEGSLEREWGSVFAYSICIFNQFL